MPCGIVVFVAFSVSGFGSSGIREGLRVLVLMSLEDLGVLGVGGPIFLEAEISLKHSPNAGSSNPPKPSQSLKSNNSAYPHCT